MSRATTCALIIALQKFSPITAEKLAEECLTDITSIREWLCEFESVGIVKRVGRKTGRGRAVLWQWLTFVPAQIVENNSLHPLHGEL